MHDRVAAIGPKTVRATLTVATCLLSLVAASGASAATSTGSKESKGSNESVSQTLARSLAAATKAGSAKITVEFFSGSTTGKVVQDSSLHSGEQTIAIGKSGKELASVVLSGGEAYISGNGKGMTAYFGLPSALVSTLAGHWISVSATDSAFQAVTANVTLPSALANVTPSGTLAAGKRLKVKGHAVKSISGTSPDGGRMTLFVAADAGALPVEAIESVRSGTTTKGEIVTFSRWGEHLHLPTPSDAVPISTLEAASSASGS